VSFVSNLIIKNDWNLKNTHLIRTQKHHSKGKIVQWVWGYFTANHFIANHYTAMSFHRPVPWGQMTLGGKSMSL
jgi:hypothetical protein